MDFYILNSRGSPELVQDERDWTEARLTDSRWHVASDQWETRAGGLVHVHTVFLGFDPRYPRIERTGPPALWESAAMLYSTEEGIDPERIRQQFYRTRVDALAGHQELVRLIYSGSGDLGGNGHL